MTWVDERQRVTEPTPPTCCGISVEKAFGDQPPRPHREAHTHERSTVANDRDHGQEVVLGWFSSFLRSVS